MWFFFFNLVVLKCKLSKFRHLWGKSKIYLLIRTWNMYICDRSEQKQPFGCTLTNPPHVTPLRPDSTVIDGFSKLIPQRIAVEISYLLVYCSWKSINKCGAGTQWRNVWWIRQGAPKRLLLLGGVTYTRWIGMLMNESTPVQYWYKKCNRWRN